MSNIYNNLINIERGQNSYTVEYLMSRNIIFMEVSACTAAGNNVRHLLVQDSAAHDILGIVTSLDIMNYFKYEGDLEEYAKWESLPTDNSLQKKLDEQC